MAKHIQITIGKYWLGKLILIFIFCFLPCIVFFDEVAFDKVKFTQEWVRSILSTIFLGFIIFFLQQNYLDNRRSLEEKTWKDQNVLSPLNEILSICYLSKEVLDESEKHKLKESWYKLYNSFQYKQEYLIEITFSLEEQRFCQAYVHEVLSQNFINHKKKDHLKFISIISSLKTQLPN